MTATNPAPVNAPVDRLDTTTGSAAHALFLCLDRGGGGRALALFRLYAIAVALTLLPLLIGAWLGPHSLVVRNAELKLPFFNDWTILFAFLVSFPCLLILTVTDQHVLDQSLKTVEAEGIITISPEDKQRVAVRWNGRFRIVNLVGQASAAMIGASIAYINYRLFKEPSLGHWIFDGRGALLGVGYVFLFCLFLFYALVSYISFAILLVAAARRHRQACPASAAAVAPRSMRGPSACWPPGPAESVRTVDLRRECRVDGMGHDLPHCGPQEEIPARSMRS